MSSSTHFDDDEDDQQNLFFLKTLKWARHNRRWIGLSVFVCLGIGLSVQSRNWFLAGIFFIGLPFLFTMVRYLWMRLCRDPFLSTSDTMSSIWCEAITTCCPPRTTNLTRTVPTIVFFLMLALEVTAAILPRTPGKVFTSSPNLNSFEIVFYNGFGSLLILVCAVWLVDGLWLLYLFLWVGCYNGKKDDAHNWWWNKQILLRKQSSETNDDNDDDRDKARQLDEERKFAKIRLVIITLLYAIWTTLSLVSAYNPTILELSVPIPRLPPQCDGYRLGVAADLHLGVLSGIEDSTWLMENMNSLEPDAVALVGDIGDTEVNDGLRAKLEPLTKLKTTDGVYLAFGNHEYIHGIEEYRTLFHTESPFKESITLLENEHVLLHKNNSTTSDAKNESCSIVLLGMGDYWEGQPNLPLALRTAPNNQTTIQPAPDLPVIMMQHQPLMERSAEPGVGLQVSGHTHGGQIWPQHITLGIYDAISGLHEINNVGSNNNHNKDNDEPSYLFVSEGIVGWGPRLRFLSKTDIAVITLRTPDLMKAEGLIPDTGMTISTMAMYAAFVLVPFGVLMCCVPCCCWLKHHPCSKRMAGTRSSSNGNGDDEEQPSLVQGAEEKEKV